MPQPLILHISGANPKGAAASPAAGAAPEAAEGLATAAGAILAFSPIEEVVFAIEPKPPEFVEELPPVIPDADLSPLG